MDKPNKRQQLKTWLGQLSFKIGMIALGICIICYILSFAQILLPISTTAKWILWVIFFGLAKTAQYTALLILGAAGIKKTKAFFHKLKPRG